MGLYYSASLFRRLNNGTTTLTTGSACLIAKKIEILSRHEALTEMMEIILLAVSFVKANDKHPGSTINKITH